MLKGKFLEFDWMVSLNPQAATIHHIDHQCTELVPMANGVLHAKIPSLCGQVFSPKWLALLSEADAWAWMNNTGYLRYEYGPRRQCQTCVRVGIR